MYSVFGREEKFGICNIKNLQTTDRQIDFKWQQFIITISLTTYL